MKFRSILSALMLITGVAAAPTANAAVIMSIQEVGSDVVATAEGSLDISGFVNSGTLSQTGRADPAAGILVFAPPAGAEGRMWFYIAGPASFGSGAAAVASSFTGSLIGVVTNSTFEQLAYLTDGYVSGSAISSRMTFAGKTLSGLGLTNGVYKWIIDSIDVDPADSESITLYIGVAPPGTTPVPVPASLLLLATGVAAAASLRRRKTT